MVQGAAFSLASHEHLALYVEPQGPEVFDKQLAWLPITAPKEPYMAPKKHISKN